MGWKWEPGLVGKMGKVFFKLINKKCGVTGDMAQLLKAKGLQPKGEKCSVKLHSTRDYAGVKNSYLYFQHL